MQAGLLFSLRNPAQFERPWADIYAQTIEQVIYAEQLGFDAVYTTEHHFADDGYAPATLPILASWATRTSRIRLGTYIALLPMQAPFRFAEDAAVVDIISGGRLTLGLGAGYRPQEFAGFNIPKAEIGAVMDEALEVLVRAWSGETLNFAGRYFQHSGAKLSPRPLQQPRPPIWVAGGSKPGARRVARWGLEGFAVTPNAEVYAHYLKKCAEFGTEPAAEAQQLLFGHIAEESEKAWEEAEPYATYVHDVYKEWALAGGNIRSWGGTARDTMTVGDPAYWIDRIDRAVAEAVIKPGHVIVYLQLAGMPHEMAMRSIDLFARSVLPHIHSIRA